MDNAQHPSNLVKIKVIYVNALSQKLALLNLVTKDCLLSSSQKTTSHDMLTSTMSPMNRVELATSKQASVILKTPLRMCPL